MLAGHDARRIADDLLRTLRDAFLQANASGRVPYDGAPEDCARLAALAKEMGNAAVVRAIEILGEAIVDIRGQAVADPRLVLEVAVVRIARREARTREETLVDRIERLEQRLADGAVRSGRRDRRTCRTRSNAARRAGPVPRRRRATDRPAAGARRPSRRKPPPTPPAAEPADAPADKPDDSTLVAEPSATSALDDVIEAWPDALGVLKAPVRAGIQDAQPIALENGIIVFGVPKRRFDAINERFRKEAAAIKEAFASRLGAAPRFMLRAHDFDKVDALRPPAARVRAAGRSRANEPPEPDDDERRPERARRRARRAAARLGHAARGRARRRGHRRTPP